MSKIQMGKVFACDHCGKVFSKKFILSKHLKKNHEKDIFTCHLCKIEFPNIENLALHARLMHKDKSHNFPAPKRFQCNVCDSSYAGNFKLKCHIRKQHYNLKAKLPYCDRKKVNQVWFEKVLNSNNIVEIKKTEQNMLLMRKLDERTSIKVNENATEVIDLQPLYPTGTPTAPKISLKRCKGVNEVGYANYNLVKPL